MDQNAISRKKFLGLSAAATGAALFSGINSSAMTKDLADDKKKAALKEYILTNVRLKKDLNIMIKRKSLPQIRPCTTYILPMVKSKRLQKVN